MFYDSSQFEFTEALEANWQQIYQEYLGVRDRAIDWYEKELYGAGWQVFGLFTFPHGQAIATNIAQCPLTTSLIERYLPTHGAAGFSILQPNTRIQPHQGYQGNFLRCHLGLQVPEGDCALQVDRKIQSWQAGKVLVFDDRITHQAWNLAPEERVILLIDFVEV